MKQSSILDFFNKQKKKKIANSDYPIFITDEETKYPVLYDIKNTLEPKKIKIEESNFNNVSFIIFFQLIKTGSRCCSSL
jgi:hypothetical protein